MGTIITLAQNFVGSNNVNLLMPVGQFGTRLHGGKDAASPRYIFTQLRWVVNGNDNGSRENINITTLHLTFISVWTDLLVTIRGT